MEQIGVTNSMNIVFDFLKYDTLYERCVIASVAHAIMVGKYNLLASEQSWDGMNYNFQNMEGIRGVISFADGEYICVIQNNKEYVEDIERHVSEILRGANVKIMDLAKEEALQYMLVNYKGKDIPFITSAFWGSGDANYSNQSEEQLIKISEKTIMPFLYSEDDAKKYWKDYYEMTDEQIELAENIYKRRINVSGRLNLLINEINKLKEWFVNIDECIESFQELGIYLK